MSNLTWINIKIVNQCQKHWLTRLEEQESWFLASLKTPLFCSKVVALKLSWVFIKAYSLWPTDAYHILLKNHSSCISIGIQCQLLVVILQLNCQNLSPKLDLFQALNVAWAVIYRCVQFGFVKQLLWLDTELFMITTVHPSKLPESCVYHLADV